MSLYIRIIFPIFVSIAVYSLLSFFFGKTGIYSQRVIEDSTQSLIKNIEMIKQKGVELDVLIKNLTSDTETIKIFAHDLGYVEKDEVILKLSKFKSKNPLGEVSSGSAIMVRKSAYISDSLCKKFAALMGLISLVIEVLVARSYDYQEREARVLSYS